jgi:trans-aconitate methyltransferase
MDLLEHRDRLVLRHPWEQSRARAIHQIIEGAGLSRVESILDYGCGDAYAGRTLLDRLSASTLVGVDLHLTDEQSRAFGGGDDRVQLTNDPTVLEGRRFDLVLLCDVIEHVADDVSLLGLAGKHLAPNGVLMVTVPAFQSLFTEHDRFLKHFRRYSRGALEGSIGLAGLELQASGYLFASLLPSRATSKVIELVRGARSLDGLGDWSGGAALTRALTAVLDADNKMLLALSRRGLKLPGLSAWALCRRGRV